MEVSGTIYLVPIQKRSFCPIAALLGRLKMLTYREYAPLSILTARLALDQKSSFLDGHEVALTPDAGVSDISGFRFLLLNLRPGAP